MAAADWSHISVLLLSVSVSSKGILVEMKRERKDIILKKKAEEEEKICDKTAQNVKICRESSTVIRYYIISACQQHSNARFDRNFMRSSAWKFHINFTFFFSASLELSSILCVFLPTKIYASTAVCYRTIFAECNWIISWMLELITSQFSTDADITGPNIHMFQPCKESSHSSSLPISR